MKANFTLVGQGVTLRAMTPYDMIESLEFAQHREKVMKYIAFDFANNTPEQQLDVLKTWNKDPNNIPLAIDENATGQHIGNCDIRLNPENKRAEIGILIGVLEAQGKGYGTEVISMLRDYIFSELDYNRLQLFVDQKNKRAIACYKKCGFVEEGLARAYYIDQHTSKSKNNYLMSIIRPEWDKLTKKGKYLTYELI